MSTETATGKLTFSKTQSIPSYCEATGVARNAEGGFDVDLIRNPKTDKLFASFNNGATAALAKSLKKTETMVISECTDEESGETFLMIHNPSSSNVEEKLSF